MVHDRLVFLPNPAQGGVDPWVGRRQREGASVEERHHDGGSSEGGGHGGRVKLEGEGS